MEMTDIVDLLGESDLRRTLAQCGINAEDFSHYELFRAFCEMQPVLHGHRLRGICRQLLHVHFAIDLLLNADHCDVIWKNTSDQLILSQPSQDLLSKTQNARQADESLPTAETASLCLREQSWAANGLLSIRAEYWEEWREKINDRLEHVMAQKHGSLLYRIPKYYRDRTPNPYAVGQILKKDTRNVTDRCLLHAQLLRQIFVFCREKGIKVILLPRCRKQELKSLLLRLKRDVGLPPLACSVPDDAIEWLLDFTAENSEVTLAVESTEALGEETLDDTLMTLSRVYPLGRITRLR